MEMITYWFFWLLAVSFNLLIIYLIGLFFLKGSKAKLHHFDEYSESHDIPGIIPPNFVGKPSPMPINGLNSSIPYSELYNCVDSVDS